MIACVPIATTRALWLIGFVQLSVPFTFTTTVSPTCAVLGMTELLRDVWNGAAVDDPWGARVPGRAAYQARAFANIGVRTARSLARSRDSKARSSTGASGVPCGVSGSR